MLFHVTPLSTISTRNPASSFWLVSFSSILIPIISAILWPLSVNVQSAGYSDTGFTSLFSPIPILILVFFLSLCNFYQCHFRPISPCPDVLPLASDAATFGNPLEHSSPLPPFIREHYRFSLSSILRRYRYTHVWPVVHESRRCPCLTICGVQSFFSPAVRLHLILVSLICSLAPFPQLPLVDVVYFLPCFSSPLFFCTIISISLHWYLPFTLTLTHHKLLISENDGTCVRRGRHVVSLLMFFLSFSFSFHAGYYYSLQYIIIIMTIIMIKMMWNEITFLSQTRTHTCDHVTELTYEITDPTASCSLCQRCARHWAIFYR